jgi:hypothetical protein
MIPEEAAPEEADAPPVVQAPSEPDEVHPAAVGEPASAERPAQSAADTPAPAGASGGKAATTPSDPVDAAVADGRKRLAEIDALLAGAED